jgi:hypothetical protein
MFKDSFSAARVYPTRMLLAVGALVLVATVLSRLQ